MIIKGGFELNIESLDISKTTYALAKDWTNMNILGDRILTLVRMYCFALTISLLIILFFVNYKYKPFSKSPSELFEKSKIFIIIWVVYMVAAYGNSFAMALHGYGNFSNGDLNDDFLLSYLQFIPYLIILLNFSIKGEKKDISNIIIKKSESDFGKTLFELKKLSASGIISEEEFENKKNQLLRTKAKSEIELSEDYQVLESLKNKGILQADEFEQKVELLIIKKIKIKPAGKPCIKNC